MIHASNQKGNVLVYILIAMALLAALTYAVSRDSGSQEVGQLNNAQMEILANDILTNITDAQMALDNMTQWGVDYDQVLFDKPGQSGYTSNTARQIYHPSGGGLIDQDFYLFKETWQNKTNVGWTNTNATDFIYVINTYGNDESEVGKAVCEIVNKATTGSSDIPVISSSTDTRPYFDRKHSSSADFNASLCPECEGKKTLCIFRPRHGSAEDAYLIYTILGSR